MEQQRLPIAQDGTLHLARLLGSIRDNDLGPFFMEILTGVVLGTEGLQRMRTGKVTCEDMWAVSCATTAQRTEAAEQVLTQRGFALLPSE